jgi:hypothetical protein
MRRHDEAFERTASWVRWWMLLVAVLAVVLVGVGGRAAGGALHVGGEGGQADGTLERWRLTVPPRPVATEDVSPDGFEGIDAWMRRREAAMDRPRRHGLFEDNGRREWVERDNQR